VRPPKPNLPGDAAKSRPHKTGSLEEETINGYTCAASGMQKLLTIAEVGNIAKRKTGWTFMLKNSD
jgi:hypothetical protein